MKKLRILIADDHELIRAGLKIQLEKHEGWKVCGEAVDGRAAVELAKELKPEIAVLDIGMPELNGLEAARQIHKACPQTEILILTMQESEALVRDAFGAGARGFILKTEATRLLISAVETLAEHKPFLVGEASALVLAGYLDPDYAGREAAGEHRQLSPREREIVQLLSEASSSKEVAAKLGISVKTVDAHRANVMRKLNLHSIAELVRYAIRNGIITA